MMEIKERTSMAVHNIQHQIKRNSSLRKENLQGKCSQINNTDFQT